jgi:hypothetical protein
MQLKGSFQGFDFAHLLQMLATTGKSGRLLLEGEGTSGLVLLRHGKIICAVSTSVRESLGSILLSRGWLEPGQLEEGLERQRQSEEEKRLGAILVEAGFLPFERLEAAVAEQVAQVISEFLRWRTGSFEFDELRFPDCGEIEVATDRLPLDAGLPADQILLGIASEHHDIHEPLMAVPSARTEVPSLPDVVKDFPAPLVTGEVAQRILDLARGVVGRGALFQAAPTGFVGMSQFGMGENGDEPADFIRSIRVSDRGRSVLQMVAEGGSQYHGVLDPTPENLQLLDQLGGSWPTECFVGPLFAGGRVMLVFYGDNLPFCQPLGDTSDLSAQLLRSGSMLEHCLLTRIA